MAACQHVRVLAKPRWVPREQKMLKGHIPRVIYHQVYEYTQMKILGCSLYARKRTQMKCTSTLGDTRLWEGVPCASSDLRILVYLVICDSEWVSLVQLLQPFRLFPLRSEENPDKVEGDTILYSRATTSQKWKAVPRRARI